MDGWQGIFEREAVENALSRLLSEAAEGRGAALFVVGQAGLGKTAVIGRGCALAGDTFRVGRVSADQLERQIAYSTLAAAMGQLGAEEVVAPVARGLAAEELRAVLANRLWDWVRRISDEGPLLLAIDDLQWADDESVTLLAFLSRRIGSLPVAIVAALRPSPSGALNVVTTLHDEGHAALAHLDPLSPRGAGALLATARVTLAAEEVTAINQACGGNPALIGAVGEALRCVGSGAPPPVEEVAIPPRLVRRHMIDLPEEALDLAKAASVLGTSFLPRTAGLVAGLEDQDLDRGATALWEAGWWHRSEAEEKATFVHPILGAALAAGLPEPIRARTHRLAFGVLLAQGMDEAAAEAAMHADLHGDHRVADVLERVGSRELSAGRFGAGCRYLGRAVTLAGCHASSSLVLKAAESLVACGRPTEAIPSLEHLVHTDALTGDTRAGALCMLGRALSASGRDVEAMERFDQATEVAGLGPRAMGDAMVDKALLAWETAGVAHSVQLLQRAIDVGDARTAFGERVEAAMDLMALLSGSGGGEALARRLDHFMPPRNCDPRWPWEASRLCAGIGPLSERLGAAAIVIGGTQEYPGFGPAGLLVHRADRLARTGPLPDALALIDDALGSTGIYPCAAQLGIALKAHVLFGLGDEAGSQRCIEQLEEADESCTGQAYLWLVFVGAEQNRRAGRLAEALRAYAHLEVEGQRLGIGEPCWVPWAAHAVTAYLEGGCPDDAERVLIWLEQRGAEAGCRWARAVAAAGRAFQAEASADPPRVRAAYEAALGRLERADLPLERCEALISFGTYLRRAVSPIEARPVLTRAIRLAEVAGARRLEEHGHEQLLVAGGRLRPSGPKDALSPQQQRVAGLAAAGHSNRDLAQRLSISVSTAEAHLEQIYAKLRINSRRQLMAGELLKRFGGRPSREPSDDPPAPSPREAD